MIWCGQLAWFGPQEECVGKMRMKPAVTLSKLSWVVTTKFWLEFCCYAMAPREKQKNAPAMAMANLFGAPTRRPETALDVAHLTMGGSDVHTPDNVGAETTVAHPADKFACASLATSAMDTLTADDAGAESLVAEPVKMEVAVEMACGSQTGETPTPTLLRSSASGFQTTSDPEATGGSLSEAQTLTGGDVGSKTTTEEPQAHCLSRRHPFDEGAIQRLLESWNDTRVPCAITAESTFDALSDTETVAEAALVELGQESLPQCLQESFVSDVEAERKETRAFELSQHVRVHFLAGTFGSRGRLFGAAAVN